MTLKVNLRAIHIRNVPSTSTSHLRSSEPSNQNLLDLTGMTASECQRTDYLFSLGDSRTIELDEDADMVFIDTLHSGWLLEIELSRFSLRTKRFIVLHDTYLFSNLDEDDEEGCKTSSMGCVNKGLMPVLQNFLEQNRDTWEIMAKFDNNNGLTVLERIKSMTCQDDTRADDKFSE